MNPTAAIGSLLGTAVGDSIGLPYEGLSPRRAAALLGAPDRQRLIRVWGDRGWGMVSDDCEHACMTAAALARSGGNPERFAAELARQLRWWLLWLPAGTGMATARASVKLWCGVGPSRSGVESAGNGPAMRAPILGAIVEEPDALRELVTISTRITHTDPRAIDGALVVALAARIAARRGGLDADELTAMLGSWAIPSDARFADLLGRAIASARVGETTIDFARAHGMERGVSGFIVHTVPIVVHASLAHPTDLRAAVQSCVRCGGDADTTAAITGGIVGAAVGPEGAPAEWLDSLWAAPRSVEWMGRLASAASEAVAGSSARVVPRHSWALLPFRNLAFLAIVLGHGFRRLAPPY